MSNLLDLFVPNATWRDGPCAEVRVGDHAIRYVRRGTGPSIVVVSADGDVNPVWCQLIQGLASSYRIIVTQPPPTGADVSAWLRGFIEGIGLTSIVLMAGGTAAAAALEVASADDFTVRKLILLPAGGSVATPVVGGDEQARGSNLLALEPGSADESLRRIQEFIAA